MSDSVKFIRIAHVDDFARQPYRSFSVLARKVGVFKDKDGSFFAREVACKHQNWDLTTGPVKGDILTCPRHGWAYNIRTGECLNHDSTPLRRYALKVEGDEIYISLLPVEE